MPPYFFWSLTLKEAALVIEGFEENKKDDYYLNLYASINAIGSCLGGKKFKLIDPFNKNNKNNHKVTKQQKEKQIKYMEDMFEKYKTYLTS